MSTFARPLAVRLSESRDDELAALLYARGVRPDIAWNDFFDAAEALLDAASIEKVLARLTRKEAEALLRAAGGSDAGAARARLTALALLDGDGRALPPVADALDGRTVDTAGSSDAPPAASDAATARAAERAFTTAGRLADILLAAHESPLALLAGGAFGATEKKRLAEGGVPVDEADDLRRLAHDAGLLADANRHAHPTPAAEEWLRAPFAERWSVLAAAFRDALPAGLRDGDSWSPPTIWPFAYPWDADWPERADRLLVAARLLGLVADGDTEPAWATALRTGDVDATALATLVPAEVDRVFLQNDLTAIAPGPLLPELDVRLRAMAERDGAQASSYRFTPESITRALIDGETATTIVDFLTALSLTGLPQPLAYLVEQTAQRHDLVRVWSDAEGTTVTSRDPHLMQAIGVDRSLRPMALTPEDGMLVTRVNAETVYWALVDARYPATLVDADGAPVPLRRAGAAEASEPPPSYGALIARLRENGGTDTETAWLDRELEAAIRAKAVLLVDVGMPDGSIRQLTLEATGLGGGRLRGLDRGADVERTLPVRSIRAVRVVE